MKLIEVAFKLDEKLPDWQESLIKNQKALSVLQSNDAARYVWIIFRVPDTFEVPE